MSKIVLLSTVYLSIPSANGICARNIAKELRCMGHEVDIVCYKSEITVAEQNVEHIYTVSRNQPIKKKKICSLLGKMHKTCKILLGDINPLFDNTLVEEYYKRLMEINLQKPIDSIIAMYFPLESVQALYKFKKTIRNVKAFVYELDSIGDGVAQSWFQAQYNRIYERWELSIYHVMDYIIIMQSHQNYWESVFGQQFSSKLKIADIPGLTKRPMSIYNNNKKVSMIYSGLIDRKYRSPMYLLSVLRKLEETLDFDFTFYSQGDCEDEIAKTAKDIKGIFQNGYVPQENLELEILKTDFLVSIGNSVSRSVPSKIITYLSYGKPIIHFAMQKEDVCINYLKNYRLALVIDQSTSIEEACNRIYVFINEKKGETVDFKTVQETFFMNDPSFSARLISDLI